MYLNKVYILGNLTRDPEMKSLPSGVTVTSFSVATNRVWKDAQGAKQESADYHNIVVFGRQAEITSQYLKKGSSVLVEGRITTRSWDGADGKKQYRTEIIAERVQFGSRSSAGGASGDYSSAAKSPASSKKEDPMDSMSSIDYPEEEINPEDIPF
jgi:single-strand DNA-binding protein